ncbi:gliding motility-associated ABC transporter substrate-binding protein GldG [Pedobacter sp. JY14-1]|uniref:gliding motility-associated ABC transporter substrate-binding protein GldG n=1 Tax=Pedobacter sp. JY14-1 TaxID=3034151 RepID=UPI0023E28F05|nr:gliding motility-associated ABC transporter substrate-binding protein GldG [Pedobacter sp. JY14-1]
MLFLLCLVLLNLLAGSVYTRIDLTGEKRYTLTEQTKSVLKRAGQDVEVTVFLDGELPSAFRKLRNAARDLLEDYRAYGGGRIRVVFSNPLEGLDTREQDTVTNNLYEAGIEPTTLNIRNDDGFAQKIVFPMALVRAGDRQLPVKLLLNQSVGANYEEQINSSVQNLEYAFTSAIEKVLSGGNPRIGFTEGNGELSDAQLDGAIKSLSGSYEVGRVNLDLIDRAGLDKLKLLVIAKPQQEFTEAQKYKLNYFVMNGGRVIWSLDQVGADLDSMGRTGEQLAFNGKLNLDDMLFMYGARINYNLLADANCTEIPISTGNAGKPGQIQMAPWVYYPLLIPDTSSNITRHIDGVRSEFVSSVDTIGVRGLRKHALLWTSPFNKLVQTPQLLSLQMVAEQPDPRDYASVPRMAAVLIEGEFPSVFLNRPVPEGLAEGYPLPERGKPDKMVVIGDGDIFKNQVSSRDRSAFPLGFDRFSGNNYGNGIFLLNLTDYLCGGEDLIALRSREVRMRLLDKARVRTERLVWQVVNITAPLGVLILFAIFQHYYRRRKYAR